MIKYYLDPDHEDARQARRGLLMDRHIYTALHKTHGWRHLASKLAGERAWGVSDEDGGLSARHAGEAGQIRAGAAFAKATGTAAIDVCLVTNSALPGLGAAPSGIIRGGAGVQIMTPSLATLAYWHRYGGLPMKYKERLLGQMLVCNLQQAHFWAWHPDCPPLHVVVEREQDALDELTEKLILAVELIHEEADRLPRAGGGRSLSRQRRHDTKEKEQ